MPVDINLVESILKKPVKDVTDRDLQTIYNWYWESYYSMKPHIQDLRCQVDKRMDEVKDFWRRWEDRQLHFFNHLPVRIFKVLKVGAFHDETTLEGPDWAVRCALQTWKNL